MVLYSGVSYEDTSIYSNRQVRTNAYDYYEVDAWVYLIPDQGYYEPYAKEFLELSTEDLSAFVDLPKTV